MFRIDGKSLREIRSDVGYKKIDFRNAFDVSLTTVTNWESGVTPKPENKVKLKEFLETMGYEGRIVFTS
jgi:DNA-binding transcriptional regulator YiaG